MTDLTLEEFKRMREKDGALTVINVLGEESYRKAHIPDTENVPRTSNDFVNRVETLAGGKDQPVVVYCASHDCNASPKAAKSLDEAGFMHVFDFEGGTKAWADSGEPVEGSD